MQDAAAKLNWESEFSYAWQNNLYRRYVSSDAYIPEYLSKFEAKFHMAYELL
jgi:hypothetical protein